MKRSMFSLFAGVAGAALALVPAPAGADGLRDEPLARFAEPVCPGVHGISLEVAEVMITRVRSNIRELGIDLAPAGCNANLMIAFLNDGQTYLERVRSETTRLHYLNSSQIRGLMSQPGPVRTLVTVEERTLDGQPVGYRENLVQIPTARVWSAHSRIYVPTRRNITSATVLIDYDAAEGMTVAQMADIATLYGLTDQIPAPARSTASIQHIFAEDAQGAEALSEFDLAFLQRLYTLPPNLPATAYVQGLPGAATLRE